MYWTYSITFSVTWVLFIRNPGGIFFSVREDSLMYATKEGHSGLSAPRRQSGFLRAPACVARWQLCRNYRFAGKRLLPRWSFCRDCGKLGVASGVGYRDQGVGGPWGITGHGFDYLVICFWSMISQWFILTQQTSAIQTWPFLCIFPSPFLT